MVFLNSDISFRNNFDHLRPIIKNTFKYLFLFSILALVLESNASVNKVIIFDAENFFPPDSTDLNDTINLIYPFNDDNGNPFYPSDTNSLFLRNPSNIESVIEYDPITNRYIYKKKIGKFNFRDPVSMSFDEYREYDLLQSIKDYWRERSISTGKDGKSRIIPEIHIGGKAFDKIFGGNTIDIRPQGSAELIFGLRGNSNDNPTLNVRQRKQTNFIFEEKIQMNVIAKIGDKIEFKTNYNTESTFDFENKLKLKYEGDEDDIVKLIEAGDVNLPLSTSLITGNQSLFGIKTKLQFGNTTITSVFSQQNSETSTITVQGGAQTNEFYLKAIDYEENRHFFIAQYFREEVIDYEGKVSNRYNEALKDLPIISSDINITNMEVWVTNIGAAVTENRNIIAFSDLGEYHPGNDLIDPMYGNGLPTNFANDLLLNLDTAKIRDINTVTNYLKVDPFNNNHVGYFVAGEDFEKIENARKLSYSEYNYNSKLGFISLNTNLNPDQTLAVAFQYTKIGDTTVYQVGELTNQGITSPQCLVVKLLKSTSLNTNNSLWNLMMKNVYSIGAYQVNSQDFMLNIFYSGNENGVPTAYLTEGNEKISGVPLIRVLNLDNLNPQSNPYPDGVFDFIDNAASNGGTIQSSNGRIYFPVLEPFGKYLKRQFGVDTALASKYAYDSLYTMTKTGAEQYPDKNKFIIEGDYKSSSSSEISLNALNVPHGSVTVTAGGIPLVENVDFTVDYTLGRVRIINEGILSSGTPINISMENNAMFSIQKKRLMGTHIEHQFSDDFNVGATILNLNERPLTQKTNYGDDPISNTIWGLNFAYETESRLLTKLIDKIPLISTKAVSSISVDGEFAHFIPGHSKAIGDEGTSYIDDFEGSKSTVDLKNIGNWFLASTPQGQFDLFPEAAPTEGINYGKNRAKLAWYIIDPLFYNRSGNLRPPNISKDELSLNSVRKVLENEIFPKKDVPNGIPTNIAVLNLAYYPEERGPYNFDANFVPGLTSGINNDGTLKDPETRWAGIMRKIETTDFESANVEYIEFWMMNPFTDGENNPGQLYFNLGDVSEDILRDSRKGYENGLPTTETVIDVDTTIWGRVPVLQAIVESFDSEVSSRAFQDVGYDGLRDIDELTFYDDNAFGNNYVKIIDSLYLAGYLAADARDNIINDPSGDNYHYFRGTDYDSDNKYSSILERYKQFNGPEGNSPSDEQNPESYPTVATNLPNVEDLNNDNTLSEAERYFQYKIDLSPEKMKVGENYITDVYTAAGIQLDNGQLGEVDWYQFKIPVNNPDKVVGNIEDFKSIRFIRMFLKGFPKPIVTRFATLELVRGEWRRYRQQILSPGEYIPNDDQSNTKFDVSAVNIEENGSRSPIPYVIPPGIKREINLGTTNLMRLNEQSMVLKVTDLIDGDARGAYKTTDFDFRQYKRLQLFVHAEKVIEEQELDYGDLTVFIRMGSDFTENYYEYEIPLTFTPWFTEIAEDNIIWPDANNFDIDLENLVQIKHNRNIKMREQGSNISTNFPYIEYSGANKISVVGVPSISNVNAIMIGVRNPKQTSLSGDDDGEIKSVEIWVNEFRLSDFNKKGGWAGNARVTVNLADIGRVTVTGMHSSPGFGSLDQKLNETQKESISQFDISTNLSLGKFFPEESGIKIPMHFDYSEARIIPEYNPLDPDILLKEDLKSYNTEAEKDSIKRISIDYTQRKNVNFMNVRKDRVGASKPPKIYDISNFDVSFAYSEIFIRNIDVNFDLSKSYNGSLGYNFSGNPKNVKPFSKIKFLDADIFNIIQDFNFYYLPKSLSFHTDMIREKNKRKLRNKSIGIIPMEIFHMKTWDWNRSYNMKFDLSESLTLDYSANANAYINEPQGNPDKGTDEYTANRDTIMNELMNIGSINRFVHSLDLHYSLPINKIPIFDWITAKAGYQATYNWTASPASIQDRMGNQIENSNTILFNADLNFKKFYNKVPYFKRLNKASKNKSRPGMKSRKMAMEDKDVEADSTETKPKINYFKIIAENTLKILMGVKKAAITYDETGGTYIPGFLPQPKYFGSNFKYTPDTSIFNRVNTFEDGYPTSLAPGLGFVFGDQRDLRNDAFRYGWLTPDTLLNQAYSTKKTNNLTIRVSIEPIPDFKIDITADRAFSKNHQEYYRADSIGNFHSFSPMEGGSYSSSIITWRTAFSSDGENNLSGNFENFKNNRSEIAERLARENPNWNGNFYRDSLDPTNMYPEGYGPNSQEVLLHSFKAAYTGSSVQNAGLDFFQKIPMPNWRLTYTGLTNIAYLKERFRKISISHVYRSAYSISSFSSYIDYKEQNNFPAATYANGNFIPKYDIGTVSIMEQFAPLIGIDVTMNNNMMAKVEYKQARNLTMSFINNQLTEVLSYEFVLGFGYKFKDVSFSFVSLSGGKKGSNKKSDLDLRADFSIRSNKTVLRRIDEDQNQISAGQKIITINTSADYMMNQKVMIRLFFDKGINDPFVSNQYKNSTTNAGISLKFMLNQ